MKRLNFVLPPFVRMAWVSGQAQAIWQPRLLWIRQAWQAIEVASVKAGIRLCAQVETPAWGAAHLASRAKKYGLALIWLSPPLQTATTSTKPGPQPIQAVLASPEHAAQFHAAWDTGNWQDMGRLLGYPACCVNFFVKQAAQGYQDSLWHIAQNTSKTLSDGTSASTLEENSYCELENEPRTNILLAGIGVRPIFHTPCAFNCQTSITLSDKFTQLGHELGFRQEIEYLRDSCAWPVEWTALHGIAEIKNPVFKISTATDATAYKYTLRLSSAVFPEVGGSGIHFPYQK